MKTNQVAIWGGNQTSAAYTGITTSNASNTVGIFPSQSFTTRKVYFYESRGLIDKALKSFCIPSETQCFIVTANVTAGNNVLPVNSTANISAGYKVQGFPFAADATVQSVQPGVSLTIGVTDLIKDIAANSNFTATNSSQDKSLCCPPTDTSPPFKPTEDGLETQPTQPNVGISSGNLVFANLVATMPDTNITEITPGAAMPSANTIELKGGDGVTYKVLCV